MYKYMLNYKNREYTVQYIQQNISNSFKIYIHIYTILKIYMEHMAYASTKIKEK